MGTFTYSDDLYPWEDSFHYSSGLLYIACSVDTEYIKEGLHRIHFLHVREKLLGDVLCVLLTTFGKIFSTVNNRKHNCWTLQLCFQHVEQRSLFIVAPSPSITIPNVSTSSRSSISFFALTCSKFASNSVPSTASLFGGT